MYLTFYCKILLACFLLRSCYNWLGYLLSFSFWASPSEYFCGAPTNDANTSIKELGMAISVICHGPPTFRKVRFVILRGRTFCIESLLSRHFEMKNVSDQDLNPRP